MTDRPTPSCTNDPAELERPKPAPHGRPRLPFGLWLVLVLGLVAGSVATGVAIATGQDAQARGNQAESNQTTALCVADRNARVTRQAALSVLSVADVPQVRERALRTSLDELDRVLEDLLAAEGSSGADICQRAVDPQGRHRRPVNRGGGHPPPVPSRDERPPSTPARGSRGAFFALSMEARPALGRISSGRPTAGRSSR